MRYGAFGLPSFCAVQEGGCRLAAQGQADIELLPATPGFVLSSLEAGATPLDLSAQQIAAEAMRLDGGAGAGLPHDDTLRHGDPEGAPDLRLLGGYFEFGAPDAALLVSLLPALLIEALRSCAEAGSGTEEMPPGLLRGLSAPRLAQALRAMHAAPSRAWTVVQLAAEAALSRSAFYERFSTAVGLPPMADLMAWRMALAKDLLRSPSLSIQQVAERVGFGSASTFSTAFRRATGVAPKRFGRAQGRLESPAPAP